MTDDNVSENNPETDAAGLPEANPAESASTISDDLGRVLDVPVEVTVELGRRRIKISEALDLGPGSVLEFAKSADEPLDIRVNNQLVARGEAVVLGDRYGVRVTEVVSPDERLRHSGVLKGMS
jgi:flagellar motor switch protein FliN/FliY